jgi:glutathione S-transferase
MADERYRLIGVPSSPYSVKLRAILRYRRLPHDWVVDMPALSGKAYPVRPVVLPILAAPDGGWHVDSTPIALLLEARHGDRPVLPGDEAVRFLCLLIEDMADEWFTKPMFHYRWAYEEDAAYCSRWLASDALPGQPAGRIEAVAALVAERQIGRMALVGCTPANAPAIEASYLRLLDILEDHFGRALFLFGSRPSLADFGLFGQLSQLAADPVPGRLMRERAPTVRHWVRRTDDASGIEGAWDDGAAALASPAVEALLRMAGDTYLPFLAANDEALKRGEPSFTVRLEGGEFSQGTFRYQAKCLAALRAAYRALDTGARARLEPLLERTHCLAALSEAAA